MFPTTSFLAGVLAVLVLPAKARGHTVDVHAPSWVTEEASKPVSHGFASFSFPVHFFTDFTGNNSHPNLFSRDILDLFYQKTGTHPYIRIGGTSADRLVYNATQEEAVVLSSQIENGIPAEVSVGPTWFEGFHNFPGSLWNFQANLARNTSDALSNTLEVCRLAMEKLGNSLIAFEIGNEPDLYAGEVRPPTYNVVDYVNEWLHYADAISEHVLEGNRFGLDEWTFFQALAFAEEQLGTFSTENAFDAGIDKTGHVKSVSLHSYAAGNQAYVRLQNSFMNHTAVAANLSAYEPDYLFLQKYNPKITYLLGETNSDYVNLDMAQVEGVFGSALWLIDYLLYGMTLNIARFNLIQGTTFGYTGWVPVESNGQAPYVRPPLYGQIVVSDVIGRGKDTQIAEIKLNQWNLSAYGVYESRRLSKYVLLNLDEWNSTTPYPRPSQPMSLGVPWGVREVKVQRLTGAGASADSGIIWGGLSWNYTDGRLGEFGHEKYDILRVWDGQVNVNVESTEAVVVTLL